MQNIFSFWPKYRRHILFNFEWPSENFQEILSLILLKFFYAVRIAADTIAEWIN